MEGWIKVHRKITESAVFDNPNLLRVWIWCLVKATHKPYKLMVGLTEVELTEGQFVTGRTKGSLELGLHPSTFYKYLKALETCQMIALSSNNKMTIVTIENWGKYQVEENKSNSKVTAEEQQSNNKVTTKEQQSNTNKNIKNNKEYKEIYIVMTQEEENFISVLENIKNYPLDRTKDLEYMREMEKRYPELDLLQAVKKWSSYIVDNPFKEKANHRSQMNTSFSKYVEWGQCKKTLKVVGGNSYNPNMRW